MIEGVFRPEAEPMRHALTRPQGFRWVVLVAGLSAAQVGCQPAKANPEDLQAKFVAAALSPAEIEEKFDLGYHTKHVDTIFARVFGG